MNFYRNDSVPHLRITRYTGVLTNDELVSYLAKLEKELSYEAPKLKLEDHSDAAAWDPTQRRIFNEYELKNKDRLFKMRLGTAFVLPGSVRRGVHTATRWVSKPGYPQEVFDSVIDAVPWIVEQLKLRNFPAPSTEELLALLKFGKFEQLKLGAVSSL
jgi:hypothetical protein